MSTYTIVTAQESKRFWQLNNAMVRAEGPAFLEHDSVVGQYWSPLDETFPDNQFCLVEQESGKAVGVGNSIPLAFEGEWAELPAGGLDRVLQKGFQDRAAGKTATLYRSGWFSSRTTSQFTNDRGDAPDRLIPGL